MASYNRTRRIAEEIRKVVSTMLISGIKDPRIKSASNYDVGNRARYLLIYTTPSFEALTIILSILF